MNQWAWGAFVFVLTTPFEGIGEDWSGFRGPGGDGHAEVDAAPLVWTSEQNIAWKTALPGLGWSSPVTRGERIFVTAAVREGFGGASFSLRLIGLDAVTGAIVSDVQVFDQQSDAPAIHAKNSHASPTPLVDGDRIYVHFGHQGTACLDLEGHVLWRNRDLLYEPVHGAGGSPILVGRALIFSCDGAEDPFVVALDKDSGRVLWRSSRRTDARNTFSFSTPTQIDVDGQPQVISPGSNVVSALDPRTGLEIWRVRYDGYSVIPKPVSGSGLLFLATGFTRPSLLAIRTAGNGDVTETHIAWRADRGAPLTPSPLLIDGFLYVVSDQGVASCFEARTGRRLWQQRLDGAYSASPLFAAGRIYFQSEEGVTTVVAAEPRFRRLAVNRLGERTLASPAVHHNDLLIRGETHLFRIHSE